MRHLTMLYSSTAKCSAYLASYLSTTRYVCICEAPDTRPDSALSIVDLLRREWWSRFRTASIAQTESLHSRSRVSTTMS